VLLSIPPNPRVTFGVRHQDASVIVIDKPSGLVTQPGKGHERDALLNGLFARWGPLMQKLGRVRDFGLLHRLDKPTSGLLIAALTREAYDGLRAQFEERTIEKFYFAITRKAPNKPVGLIRRSILEEVGDKKLARVSPSGRPSITAYRVLSSGPLGCLLECRPITGRLHQVRVHLESIGCDVLGDTDYATKAVASAAPRLALHAHSLKFTHPITGEKIRVVSPMPKELMRVLKHLRLEWDGGQTPASRSAQAPASGTRGREASGEGT
jgi:23S rRNA pseudouridine1911/1915/1917 synthase